ncbi:MAG: GatB/YqeY domain-containing protein [Acidobacteria bacterium]|nr:GatB/YqeY domain-containing protein [Acidobacteriota bacterium]
MTLHDRITQDIAEAMKAREQARLSALRMAKAALMNASVSKGRELEEGEAQQVLAGLIKQRRDSIEQFRAAGRTDLAEREAAEIGVLERYAPPGATAEEIAAAVDKAIADTGAAGPKDIGRVMKAVMSALAGKTVDGKAVNELVRKKL